MFLEKLIKENKQLIEFSLMMHKQGVLLPDTYVIDVDQVIENGKEVIKACGSNIEAIFMLKQLGRNPYIASKLLEVGFTGAVAVDFNDCLTLINNKIPIVHAGHLVQIPSKLIKKVLSYGVEFITVYSYEKALQISKVAKEIGINQKLFIKVFASKEHLYNGQLSGVAKEDVLELAQKIKKLPNVQISGLTTFPAFIYSCENDDIVETPNLEALNQAKKILSDNGFNITEINVPSSNCVYNIPLVIKNKGTMIEPGHALSGTTMMHAKHNLEEKISYLYLTEVSHVFENSSLVYGGGYYARGNLSNAIVTSDMIMTKAHQLSPESIDYHLQLDGQFNVGSPVVMCYRTQMFVTRSNIALVEGLKEKNPKLIGIYDSQGKKLK